MNPNVIEEYTSFIKKELQRFYRLVLGKKYVKELAEELIDRYILVRYYNETNYPKTKDIIDRISKELMDLIKPYMKTDKENQAKSTYALFGYLIYFDECYYVADEKALLDVFFEDENIKVEFDDNSKKEIRDFLKLFERNKLKFHKTFDSSQFSLEERRIRKNLMAVKLNQRVRVSNLYSDYAIEKAFSTGVINEDKLIITLLMLCEKILQNAISLDFSRYYIVDFASTLLDKGRKIDRVFNYVDNNLAKKYIIINLSYEDYLKDAKKIEELISQGYSFSLTINETFDENYDKLILFTYVFLYEDSQLYDMILENKERIKTQMIIL